MVWRAFLMAISTCTADWAIRSTGPSLVGDILGVFSRHSDGLERL